MDNERRSQDGRNWRMIGFYIAVVVTIGLFGVMFGGVMAAMALISGEGEGPGYEFPQLHRWHDVQWAAHTGILLVGALVGLLLGPARRPVLLQFLAVATLALGIASALLGEFMYLAWLIPVAILIWLYPHRDSLLRIRPDSGWNLPVAAVGIVVGLALLPEALDKLQLQLDNIPGDEHAEFLHWGIGIMLVVQYMLAGLLAASNRPGSQAVGLLAGLSLTFLGFGALVLDGEPGVVAVWGTSGATLAIVAGLAFIAATAGARFASTRSLVLAGRSEAG